jgi:hypothetical protein
MVGRMLPLYDFSIDDRLSSSVNRMYSSLTIIVNYYFLKWNESLEIYEELKERQETM